MPKPFVIHDPYFEKAKKLGYRARSAFKLIEIQQKYNLIKPAMNVLDVASAPGSFLQVIAKIIGQKGKVVGIDIQKIDPNFGFPNIHLLQESIFEFEKIRVYLDSLEIGQFDLITSDIAPATTGMTGVDQYRSIELNLAILEVAKIFLKKGGSLVLKVFVGEDIEDLMAPLKENFKKVSRFKPKACRDRSFEEYFVCIGKIN
ncbi:MAG: RlmE family RNA methyltransferase [Candidatus Gracilibacteria bacterium]|nr:RlmE family RNA methyltransferase [Candidatus Gracilibacteria bacterium]